MSKFQSIVIIICCTCNIILKLKRDKNTLQFFHKHVHQLPRIVCCTFAHDPHEPSSPLSRRLNCHRLCLLFPGFSLHGQTIRRKPGAGPRADPTRLQHRRHAIHHPHAGRRCVLLHANDRSGLPIAGAVRRPRTPHPPVCRPPHLLARGQCAAGHARAQRDCWREEERQQGQGSRDRLRPRLLHAHARRIAAAVG